MKAKGKRRAKHCPSAVHDSGKYTCSRCGGCYQCEHETMKDNQSWRCRDGKVRPMIFDAEGYY